MSRRAALIPAGAILMWSAVVQPLIQWTGAPWAPLLTLVLLLPLQTLAIWWGLTRAQWPAMARALVAVGYEVCPACGFDLSPLPHQEACCPECGSPRLRNTFLPGTPPPSSRPTLIAQAGETT
jgi:hypothetical protein